MKKNKLPMYQEGLGFYNRPNYRDMYADQTNPYMYPTNIPMETIPTRPTELFPSNLNNVAKDMYGRPIYPSNGYDNVNPYMYPTNIPMETIPTRPTELFPSNLNNVAKDMYGRPIYPSNGYDNVNPSDRNPYMSQIQPRTQNQGSTEQPPMEDKNRYWQGIYSNNMMNRSADQSFFNAGANFAAMKGINQGTIDAPKGAGVAAGVAGTIGILSGALQGTKSALAGAAMQKSFTNSENAMRERNRNLMTNNYIGEEDQFNYMRTNLMGRQFQDGGNPYIGSEQEAIYSEVSGEILPEPENPNNNVELEDGEYVLNFDTGEVRLVVGQEHQETSEYKDKEYSGVPTTLQPNEVVISNNGKVDKKVAKELGVPNAKTYAEIIKKHKAQKEIDKLNEKIAELTKKSEKYLVESTDPKVQTTNSKNLEYISSEIKEYSEEMKPYQQEIYMLASKVYQMQEDAKAKGTYDGIKPPLDEQEEMQDGGIVRGTGAPKAKQIDRNRIIEIAVDELNKGVRLQDVISMLEKQGVPRQLALELTQGSKNALQSHKSFQDGGGMSKSEWISNKIKILVDEGYKQDQAVAVAYSMYDNRKQDGETLGTQAIQEFKDFFGNLGSYSYGDLPSMRERFKYFNKVYGVGIPESDIEKADINTLNKYAGQMQQSVIKQYPEVASDFGTSTEPTRKGLQWAADNGIINPKEYPTLFSNGKAIIGLASSKVPTSLSTEVQAKIAEGLKTTDLQNKYSQANFADNEWYYRAPEVRKIKFGTQEELDKWKEENKTNKLGESDTYQSGQPGAYIVPYVEGTTPPEAQLPERERPDRNRDRNREENPYLEPLDRTVKKSASQVPLIGYQRDILSGVRIPPNLQLDREEISPTKISPEQTLRENQKNAALYGNIIAQNVGATGTQALAIADVNNKAVQQSQQFNAQEAARVEAANAQLRMQQNQANIGLMDTYNQRALLAEENTLNQINQARREQRNWDVGMNKDAQTWAALQASNPNYQFGYNPYTGQYDVNYVDRWRGIYAPQNIVGADIELGMNKDAQTWAALQASNPNYQFGYNPYTGQYDVDYVDRGRGLYAPQNIVGADIEQRAQPKGQEGGQPQNEMIQMVAQALQQGISEEEILQGLMNEGLSQEEAMQLIQISVQYGQQNT